MAATPEPSYTVLEQQQDFELRLYAPQIIAQTEVSGNYNEASRKGFGILANYIFGNNTVAVSAPEGVNDSSSAKISMTAPVIMAPAQSTDATTASTSAKISMTAPVSMSQSEGKWQVVFVMPETYSMQTLPKPNNPAITLKEIPEQRYAVIRFSGLAGADKVAKKTSELQQWMADKNLNAIGIPKVARYNPPWTLPFLRRNEIMVQYQ